jgi:hypothetical protein
MVDQHLLVTLSLAVMIVFWCGEVVVVVVAVVVAAAAAVIVVVVVVFVVLLFFTEYFTGDFLFMSRVWVW